MLKALTDQLGLGRDLSAEQAAASVSQLVEEAVPVEAKADFLSALARKGEAAGEIAAFARELRARAVTPPLDAETRARDILDVCGTGGDRLNTFNISTTVALIAAAAGVTVAKHGNRAITSQAGSADVLEALGIPIELSPEQAAQSLREHGFAFFFAPRYHPAFRHIGPARKLCAERGQRTIFNFLGPLLNPARPTAQLVGVPRPQLCEPLARVLQSLGVRRGMVVSGNVIPPRALPPFPFEPTNRLQMVRVIDTDGTSPPAMTVSSALELAKKRSAQLICIAPRTNPPVFRVISPEMSKRLGLDDPTRRQDLDELSTLGENTIAEFYQDRGFHSSKMSPTDFPLQPATLADLTGGDRSANAEIVRRILDGEERGPKRDAVLLNAGAALFVAGKARSMAEGWDLAAAVIDDGAAKAKLKELSRA